METEENTNGSDATYEVGAEGPLRSAPPCIINVSTYPKPPGRRARDPTSRSTRSRCHTERCKRAASQDALTARAPAEMQSVWKLGELLCLSSKEPAVRVPRLRAVGADNRPLACLDP